MLVLQRKVEEDIVIVLPDGQEIVVTVTEIRNGCKVRLGIQAGGNIKVHRREVWEAIQRQTLHLPGRIDNTGLVDTGN